MSQSTVSPSKLSRVVGITEGVLILAALTALLSCYANLAFLVTDKSNFRFFPPFERGYDINSNDHLGAEHLHIAQALSRGRGFSDPFGVPAGPTAWMAPAYPALLAGLLQLTEGDLDAVVNAILVLKFATFVVTGFLLLLLTRRTLGNDWLSIVVTVFTLVLGIEFWQAFQMTHDSWLVLLAIDGLIAGLCLTNPFRSWGTTLLWGCFGGACALTSPVVGMTWAILSSGVAWHNQQLRRVLVAGLFAFLVILPWTIRNYQVFGRVVPIKSNLAYELYQSQCLQSDGVLQSSSFSIHPNSVHNDEGNQHQQLGEKAYLDRKWDTFLSSVQSDPSDFVARIVDRALAATLVYVPLQRGDEDRRPWSVWVGRVTHPLPFVMLILLLLTHFRKPLQPIQWAIIAMYFVYLLPYVLASYYERYAFPLLPVKVLLVVWGFERLWHLGVAQRTVPQLSSVRAEEPGLPSTPQPWFSHHVVAGAIICGVLLWQFGAMFKDMIQPRIQEFRNSVILPDFFQEWSSAKAWEAGENPYGSLRESAKRYLNVRMTSDTQTVEVNAHPPASILLALPFALLEFDEAFVLWNELSLLALLLSLYLIFSTLKPEFPAWAYVPGFVALIFSFPFWNQMIHGQLNLFLLLLITGGWVADRQGKAWLAGSLIGIAAAIKLFPGFLLLYFLLTGRWRSVLAGGLAFLACCGLSMAMFGADIFHHYVKNVLPVTSHYVHVWSNESLNGLWFKLFSPETTFASVKVEPIMQSRGVAFALSSVTTLVLAWLAARVYWRDNSLRARDQSFSIAVVGMVLASPIAWDHTCLLLMLPLTYLWIQCPRGRSRVLFGIAVCILAISPYRLTYTVMHVLGIGRDPQVGVWTSPPRLTLTFFCIPTYALIAILGLCLRSPRSSESKSNTESDPVSAGNVARRTQGSDHTFQETPLPEDAPVCETAPSV